MRPFNCKTCGTQILVVGDREAELETERDALRARVAELEEALRRLLDRDFTNVRLTQTSERTWTAPAPPWPG